MRELRVRTIASAIADAAQRWRDADFPPRVRATRAIEERMRYTEPVIDFALDELFGTIDAASIEAIVVDELGDLAALERFIERNGRPPVTYRARSPIAIVSSDTTIGVAIPTVVFALCAGAEIRVKDRNDGLVRAFVETLIEELPDLRNTVTVAAWDGTDDVDANRMLDDAEVVVAFGGNDALAAIRARLRGDATFVAMGHRTSIAYVARESLCDDARATAIAAGLARDVLLYDGEGCLSAHAIFCESGGTLDAIAFARILAHACDDTAVEFPAGYVEPDAAVVRYRDAARFRAAQGSGAVFSGPFAPHVLVLDPPRTDPPPFLRRTAAIYGVTGSDEARDFLRNHSIPLEAVAFSDTRADLEAFARASGASRACAIGELQLPPLAGDHGGFGRILPLVRAIYRA